jgi:tetratricopeptide (TPR) repeat protein
MAPEQARGSGAVGPPADVFALGCVLFECLAGQAPFASDRLDQLIYEEAPRLEVLRPEMPAALAALVASMLSKKPGQRPADGTAVMEELATLRERPEGGAAVQWGHRPSLTRLEQRYVSVIAMRLDPARTLEPQALAAAASALLSLAGEPPETWSESRGPGAVPPGGSEDTPPEQDVSRGLALEQQLQSIATPFGAQVESLGEGAFVALMLGQGVATDQVVRAGRCVLALRGALPKAQLVLATGRCVLGSRLPLGEVLDRAMALLELPAESGDIRLDAIAAGLLGAAFEVGEDPAGPWLRGERKGDRARTLLGKRTTCVGRERELAMLAGLYEECVSESVARAVLVTAPAGMGKSRLRYELVEQLKRHRERPLVLMACGDPMQSGSPLVLLRQILREAADLGEVAREERYGRLRAWLGRRLARAELEQVGEFLGEMAGASPPVPGPVLMTARRDPAIMGEQLRRALSCWLRAECAAQPVVLVLENLQWGDLPSIKLVDVALGVLGDHRLLVMGFGRPEVHELFPELWVGRTLQEIRLGPLTRKASASLVRQVLGGTVDQSTMEAVVERAAGHAFYLEELIRAVAEGRSGALPETVLAMAQARLDTLGGEDRRLLRAASIFGERFTSKDLIALLGAAAQGAEVETRLGELAERELLTCDIQAGVRACAFRHSLLREGTYSTLTEEDKRLGHLLAAEWLEHRSEREALLVAQHFELGGHPERAVSWYLQAARQALVANDFPAAIARSERGEHCGATGETLGELRLIAARAHMLCGEMSKAGLCCLQALELLPRGSQRWYEAANVTIMSETMQGLVPAIILEMTRFEPQGPITPDEGEMTGLALSALALLGMPEQVSRFVERLERRAHLLPPGDPAAGWLDFAQAFRAVQADDDAGSALQLFAKAATAFERVGDLRALAWVQLMSSIFLLVMRDAPECERLARLALATAERLNLRVIKGPAKIHLGWSLAARGEIEAGCALVRDALAVDISPSNHWGLTFAHAQLADALLQAGQLQESKREAQKSLALALMLGEQIRPLRVLGEAQLQGGHAVEALATMRKAQALLQERRWGASCLVWQIHYVLAQVLEACGDPAGAREAALRARDCLLTLVSTFQDLEARRRLLRANHEVLELAERWLGATPEEVSPG